MLFAATLRAQAALLQQQAAALETLAACLEEHMRAAVPDRVLSLDEAAGLLGVSPDSVRRLIAQGTLPVVRLGPTGRRQGVRLQSLLRYLAEREVWVAPAGRGHKKGAGRTGAVLEAVT
jgi:excisionase family DNA binding protein